MSCLKRTLRALPRVHSECSIIQRWVLELFRESRSYIHTVRRNPHLTLETSGLLQVGVAASDQTVLCRRHAAGELWVLKTAHHTPLLLFTPEPSQFWIVTSRKASLLRMVM